MSFSYVARQEILDINRNTIAYELLFRDGPNNSFPDVDPEQATNRLLSEQFLSYPDNVLGKKLGYVNFPYQSLINKIPTLFPKNKIVIEILEDCPPTDELFETLKYLSEMGYMIALDDFVPSAEWDRFYPLIRSIKIDLRITSMKEAALFIENLHNQGSKIKFLAEKVETYDEFRDAIAAGFTLFQGFFFSKPEMVKQKSINSSFLTSVKLFKVISKPEIDYSEIEEILSLDVTLSYKLLRYVNSSGLIRSEIKSFHQALAYLGQERLRKFISLAAISSTVHDKPESLLSLSIQRAKFSELIAKCLNKSQSKAFLTGMFSLLDSLLDQPLETIINAISIDKEIQQAILYKTGQQGEILSLVIAYEQANWDAVLKFKKLLNIDPEPLIKCYEQSLTWTDELFK